MKYKSFIIVLAIVAMGLSMESCNGCSRKKYEPTPIISPYGEDENLEIYLPNADVVDVPYTESSNLENCSSTYQ